MDWVFFVLVILGAFAALYLIRKFDCRAKNRYRKEAYRLLDTENPAKQELKRTIKGVRLYIGRFRKDQEMMQLRDRLEDKLYSGEE